MAKYKVIVLRVQGINKNTYGPGDIVSDDNFPEGNAAILAKEGKLELIVSENKSKRFERKEEKE